MPQPGTMPTRACVSAKRALVEATRMSQLIASSMPPVIAKPFTAAMVGLPSARNARVDRAVRPELVRGERRGLEFLQVHAGGEGLLAGTGDDHHLDRVVGTQCRERRAEAAAQFGRQRVHLSRTVEGQGRDAVADFGEQDVVHSRLRGGRALQHSGGP